MGVMAASAFALVTPAIFSKRSKYSSSFPPTVKSEIMLNKVLGCTKRQYKNSWEMEGLKEPADNSNACNLSQSTPLLKFLSLTQETEINKIKMQVNFTSDPSTNELHLSHQRFEILYLSENGHYCLISTNGSWPTIYSAICLQHWNVYCVHSNTLNYIQWRTQRTCTIFLPFTLQLISKHQTKQCRWAQNVENDSRNNIYPYSCRTVTYKSNIFLICALKRWSLILAKKTNDKENPTAF